MSVQWRYLSLFSVVVMTLGMAVAFTCSVTYAAQPGQSAQDGYDGHQNMMDQLGIKQLRPGANPNNQSAFEEATANPYKDSMPDVLTMKDGTKVTSAAQWPKRRAEILEDFEREVYGRIPPNVPKVTWEVTATTDGNSDGIPTVTKTLVGHVDNSTCPEIAVNIQASFTVPAGGKEPVPMMLEFGFGGWFGGMRGGRDGKAALVTAAFDERVAVAFVASSGEGGAKLHRHIFGEAVENLTGRGGYHWMAGNFLKYGASDPCMTAADLPVDSHELIALCAPRPCFISYGVLPGDPPWVDAHGSFMAGVLAGPVYTLLGKNDFGTPGNYLTDSMPPVGTLIGGELAWRQHEGGHTSGPNWPAFFEWVGQYIKAPPLPSSPAPGRDRASGRPDAPASVQPIARMDQNSRIAHAQLLEKARKGGIDVYFEGDSITRRWGALDYPELLANWRQNFFGWNAADFAWGSDTVQNILWRIENGELDNVHPKVIVLLAGTNNIGSRPSRGDDDPRIAEVTAGIRAILNICQAKAPEATIILTGIFPRNDNTGNPTGVMPLINRINENIAGLADGNKVRYININDKLADDAGNLYAGMTMDRLHLSLKGCQVWADTLKPILTELLGPPAKEDHSPPPTGDPSAVTKPQVESKG
ncbi:hypothetical protein HQ563_02750 [bacterium]|nr:hypothetical protein [bacterium]